MKEVSSSNPSNFQNKSDDEEEEKIDAVSEGSSSDIEELNSTNGAVVAQEDGIGLNQDAPCFGNISVMNSNDVHFGNKTVYQGPVTIKQFLYNNGRLQENDPKQLDADGSSANNSNLELNVNNLTNSFLNGGYIPDSEFNTKNGDISNNCLNKLPETTQSKDWWSQLKKKKLLVISTTTLAIFSLVIILTFTLKEKSLQSSSTNQGYGSEGEHNTPIDYASDNISIRIISRPEWVAQPPVKPIAPLQTPVSLVVILDTATENCTTQARCILHIRIMQTYHIESKGWNDIGFNFLVGGDGAAYEGRGWNYESTYIDSYSKRSIEIAFIGTFIKRRPNEEQIDVCKKLIEKGVALGYIKKDYKLLGGRQLLTSMNPPSPGLALFNEIRNWTHWVEKP